MNERQEQPSAEANVLHAIMDGAGVDDTWLVMGDWTDRELQDFDLACTKGAARASALLVVRLDVREYDENDR